MVGRSKRIVWVGIVASLVLGVMGPGAVRGDIVLDIGQYEDAPDPNGLYIFHAKFTPVPGEQISTFDFFEVMGIQHGFPGINSATQPVNWGSSITQTGGTPSDPTYSVKWSFIGTVPITTGGDLGTFTYEVTGLPSGGLPITLTYIWQTTLNGQPRTGSGTVVVTAVPEPSQVLLLGVAGVASLVTVGVRRRARIERAVQQPPT
jgi:hypothetical protein